jgi:hypothetical protein
MIRATWQWETVEKPRINGSEVFRLQPPTTLFNAFAQQLAYDSFRMSQPLRINDLRNVGGP